MLELETCRRSALVRFQILNGTLFVDHITPPPPHGWHYGWPAGNLYVVQPQLSLSPL
jgi:hypothetical protein